MNEMNPNRLLILDDDPDVSDFLATVAARQGFDTSRISDPGAIVTSIKTFEPTLIALDLQMPDMDGVQVLRALANERCEARVMIISGVDGRTLNSVEQLGTNLGLAMVGCLQKPVMVDDFRKLLGQSQGRPSPILREDLESGIENGELYIDFQPIAVRQENGEWRVDSAEALVRWLRADDDVVGPEDMIPLAETWGLLPALTKRVLEQTLTELRVLEDNGIILCASVNIAPSMLVNADFPDELETHVQSHGFDNSRITLEMTETSIMNRPDLVGEILSRLRIKGFGLAIDDFGTGYSSLQQLYRLPFNELKIDTSFVLDMQLRADAKTIVEASIWLAHKMGMRVCAEGVETCHTFGLLDELGCDRIQGYLVSRPVAPGKLPLTIASWQEMAGRPHRGAGSA